MEKMHLTAFINAPREKVWNTMLEKETYEQWTAAFMAGSTYRGSWEKDAKMLFVAPDPKTGKESGMVARIAENRPHEFVSIEHLGVVEGDVEDTTSDKIKNWAGAHENYTFTEKDGGTELTIDMDVAESEKDYMQDAWQKALQKLKELSEQ